MCGPQDWGSPSGFQRAVMVHSDCDGSQSGVPGTPSLGNVLELQFCGVPPRTAESETGKGTRQSGPEPPFLTIPAHTAVKNHCPRVGF